MALLHNPFECGSSWREIRSAANLGQFLWLWVIVTSTAGQRQNITPAPVGDSTENARRMDKDEPPRENRDVWVGINGLHLDP